MAKRRNTSFISNVGKSVGYSALDAIGGIMPNLKSNLSKNIEFVKTSYNPVKEKLTSKSEVGRQNPIAMSTKEFMNNALADLKTGKFYNKERLQKAEKDSLKSMGFDFDESAFDDLDKMLDGNFDVGDNDSSDTTLNNQNNIVVNNIQSGGNEALNMGISNLGLISNSVLKTNATSFSTISYQISKISQFNNENTVNFYRDVSEKLDVIANNTQKLGSFITEMSEIKSAPYRKNYFRDITNIEGLDLKEIFEVYKNKSGLKKDSFDGIKMLFNMAIKPEIDKAISNPLGFLMTKGMQMAIPSALRNTMGNMNDTLGALPILMQSRFKNMKNSKNFFTKMLGDFLYLEPNKSKLSNFGSYGKDRAIFDNMTRRSITHVIPGLLSKILASVSDNPYYKKELVYDYDKGKFTNKTNMVTKLADDVNSFEENEYVKKFKGDIIDSNTKNMSYSDKSSFIKELNSSINGMIKRGEIINGNINPSDISKNEFVAKAILQSYGQLNTFQKTKLMKSFAESISDFSSPYDNIIDNEWMQSAFDLDFSNSSKRKNNPEEKIKEQMKESMERIKKSDFIKNNSNIKGLYENFGKLKNHGSELDPTSFLGKINNVMNDLMDTGFSLVTGEDNFQVEKLGKYKPLSYNKNKKFKNTTKDKNNINNDKYKNINSNSINGYLAPISSNIVNIKNILGKMDEEGIKSNIIGTTNNFVSSTNYSDILMTMNSKLDHLESLKDMNLNIIDLKDSVQKISVFSASNVIDNNDQTDSKNGFFRNIYSKLNNGNYKEAFRLVGSKINSLKNSAKTKGMNFIRKPLDFIKSILNMDNMKSIWNSGKDLYNDLSPYASSIFNTGKGAVKNLFSLGKSLGTKGINWIGNSGIPMLQSLLSSGGKLGGKGIKWFGNSMKSILSSGGKLGGKGLDFLKSLNFDSSGLSSFSNKALNFGKDSLNWVKGKFSNSNNKLSQLFSSGKDLISKFNEKEAIKNSQMVYITGGNLNSIKEVVLVKTASSEMNSASEQRQLYEQRKKNVIDLNAERRKRRNKNSNDTQTDNEDDSQGSGIFSTITDLFGDKIGGKITSTLGKTKIGSKALSLFGKGGNALGKAKLLGGSALGKVAGFGGKAAGALGIGSKASGLLGAAGGVLGKVALPLMAAKGVFDGFKGWGNAGRDFGTGTEAPTLGQKASSAAGGVLNGLTFGLPDKIFGQGSTSRFIHGAGSTIGKIGKTALKYSPLGIASSLLSTATANNTDTDAKKENSLGENANDPNVRTATFLEKMSKFFLKGPFAILFGGATPGIITIFKKMFTGIKGLVKGLFGGDKNGSSGDTTLGGSTEYGAYGMTFQSETGGSDPGMVSTGAGDYGGQSAGLFQFSRNMGSLKDIVNSWASGSYGTKAQQWGKELSAVYNDQSAFASTWKKIAGENSKEFGQAQIDYWNDKHYFPFAKSLKGATGYDVTTKSQGLQAAAISTVTQHGTGGALSIFKKSINNVMSKKGISSVDNISDSDMINAIYDERGKKNSSGALAYFTSSSASVQSGVATRFNRERQQALSMAGSSTNSSSSESANNTTNSSTENTNSSANKSATDLAISSSSFWKNSSESYWSGGSSTANATNVTNARNLSNTVEKTSRNFSSGTEVINENNSVALAQTEMIQTTEELKMDIMRELQTQLNDLSSNTASSNDILSSMLKVLQDMKNNSNNVGVPSSLNSVLQGY